MTNYMKQHYRSVLRLYKRALRGDLAEEAVLDARKRLAEAATEARLSGESDEELRRLMDDITDLRSLTAEKEGRP